MNAKCRALRLPMALFAAWTTIMSGTANAARYALSVGIDHYAPAYGARPLPSCINDATGFASSLLLDPARWPSANVTVLTDAAASKSALRAALVTLAGRAAAGDVVVYFHSSHGGRHSGFDAFLCSYDANYEDFELAADLARFQSGVSVIIVIDACYSAGLFKTSGPVAAAGNDWDFAGNVMRKLPLAKAALSTAAVGASPAVGWLTACNYDELSWAGYPYSLFAGYVIDGFRCADTNRDTLATFQELFDYAAPRTLVDNPSQTAQAMNSALLSATIAAVVPGDLGTAVEAPRLTWSTGAQGPWTAQVTTSHDGRDAAESGVLANGQTAWLQTWVTGPGSLSFWWKVSSQAAHDVLAFAIDGVTQGATLSGEADWQQRVQPIGDGVHRLTWFYQKDAQLTSGDDRGWLDQVVWEPAGRCTMNVSFPGQWIGVMAWDMTAGQWAFQRSVYGPTRAEFTGLMPNRWYWLGLWNYQTGSWVYGGWTTRVQ